MTLRYDASTASVPQSGNWQCSAASSAWLLDALGVAASQDDVVNALGPGRIDPSVGLHDHTGSGLAAMLSDAYGVATGHQPVSFDDAVGLASSGPLLLGGDAWDHWTGVRGTDGSVLELANPSPGWMGVGTTLDRQQFGQLGPFYAVWPTDVSAGADATTAPVQPGTSSTASTPPRWALVAAAVALAWALDLLP